MSVRYSLLLAELIQTFEEADSKSLRFDASVDYKTGHQDERLMCVTLFRLDEEYLYHPDDDVFQWIVYFDDSDESETKLRDVIVEVQKLLAEMEEAIVDIDD